MMSGVPLETCRAFKNFGIVNSITKLHFVGISTEFVTLLCSDPKTCVVFKSYCNSCFPMVTENCYSFSYYYRNNAILFLLLLLLLLLLLFCRAGRPFSIKYISFTTFLLLLNKLFLTLPKYLTRFTNSQRLVSTF
jgi:hypothetical protein